METRGTIRCIARVTYDACRSHAMVHSDSSRPDWSDLEEWQRNAIVNQVVISQRHPDHTAEELHEVFLADRTAAGWTRGTRFSRHSKRCPLMRPWGELSPFQRCQDELALAQIRFFAVYGWSN